MAARTNRWAWLAAGALVLAGGCSLDLTVPPLPAVDGGSGDQAREGPLPGTDIFPALDGPPQDVLPPDARMDAKPMPDGLGPDHGLAWGWTLYYRGQAPLNTLLGCPGKTHAVGGGVECTTSQETRFHRPGTTTGTATSWSGGCGAGSSPDKPQKLHVMCVSGSPAPVVAHESKPGTKSFTVACTGKLVGGGCSCPNDENGIDESYPVPPSTWRCTCSEKSASNQGFAICINKPIVVAHRTDKPCPPGHLLLAGGCQGYSALSRSAPADWAKGTWGCKGFTSASQPHEHVLCAKMKQGN